MPGRRKPKTEFGLEVLTFTVQNGTTVKALAAAAEVSLATLHDVSTGRSAGHELIPKVREYMDNFEKQKAAGGAT